MRIPVAALLIASPFAFVFAGSSVAIAQNTQNCGGGGAGVYGGYDPPNETVIITAPRFQTDHQRLNTPPGRLVMQKAVSYADLDLCSPTGRHAFRDRIRQAAADICATLPAPYTHSLPSDANCYRDALARAQPKVDFAIDVARGNR